MSGDLPKYLYRFFWDVDPKIVDTEKNKQYVIERLLQWGGIESLSWVGKRYSRDDLAMAVKKSRTLPRRDAVFYATIFGIKREEILCLNQAWRAKHRRIWRR